MSSIYFGGNWERTKSHTQWKLITRRCRIRHYYYIGVGFVAVIVVTFAFVSSIARHRTHDKSSSCEPITNNAHHFQIERKRCFFLYLLSLGKNSKTFRKMISIVKMAHSKCDAGYKAKTSNKLEIMKLT